MDRTLLEDLPKMTAFRSLLAVAMASAVLPTFAAAQMTASITNVEGRTNTAMLDLSTQPVNGSECDMNIAVTLRFMSVPTDKTRLDVWRVSGSTDCADPAMRTPMPTTTCTPVTLVADTTINMRSTFDLTFGIAEAVDCAAADSSYRIYFLAADGTATSEVVDQSVYLEVRVDQTAPAAPTGATGLSGGTQVDVSWTAVADGDLNEYRVYGDPGSIADGATCGASIFVEGQPVPAGATLLATTMGPSATVDPRDLGVEENQSAAIVVVAVDDAGNESVVSNVACISRVPTTGFCDAYGECDSCSVAARPGGGAGSGAAIGALLFAAAAAIGRRRSRRRKAS